MTEREHDNWLAYMNFEVDFYQRSNKKRRREPGYPWETVDSPIRVLKGATKRLTFRQIMRGVTKRAMTSLGLYRSREWLNNNSEKLWATRKLLKDDLSKLLFDYVVVLRLSSHQHFFYPRTHFEEYVKVLSEESFNDSGLPNEYLGIPLQLLTVELAKVPVHSNSLKIVAFKEFITLLNDYRQYLIRRNSLDFSPCPGDTVLDCGACIGDMSLIFAGLVSEKGEVHVFDPVPLHVKFCRLQSSLNPSLTEVLRINELAVSNRTYETHGHKHDTNEISPGGLCIDSFSSTSLDDYAAERLKKVDYIKMDVEGAEMDAICGARNIIEEFKPRLAISAYHKPDDLWEIPLKLKSLNPGYDLYFGHHSPCGAESVFYAVQEG